MPSVSKRLTNRKVNTTISISTVNRLCHSNFINMGEMLGGRDTRLPSGTETRPNVAAKIVDTAIPIRKEPCTFL